MRRAVIAIAVIVGLVAIAIVILALPWTLNRVAQHAAQRTGGHVTIGHLSGSLLWGPIGFDEIRYRNPGEDIVARNGRIAVQRWPLLSRRILIDRADIETVAFEPHPQPERAPSSPPQSLQLPVLVTVQQLSIQRIELAQAPWLALGPIGARVDLMADAWTLQIEQLQTNAGRIAGEARLATARPFPLNGLLKLTSDKPALAADAQLGGTLETVALQLTASAGEARADAHTRLTPFASGLVEHLDLAVHALDPRYFRDTAPTAKLNVDAAADRAAQGDRLTGHVLLTNDAPGTWDQSRLPLAKLAGAMQGTLADMALDKLLLDLSDAGKLSGNGRLRGAKIDLDLTTRRLDLSRVHARLYQTDLAGSIRAKASEHDQRFVMSLTQHNGRIDAQALLTSTAFTLEKLRASAAGGSVVTHGRVSLEGDHPLAFKGTVTQFDPSRFGRFPRSRINSRFDARGSLLPVLQLTADLDVFDSQLAGMTTAGRVRWHSKGTKTPDIAVDLSANVGATKARARGTLFDPIHVGNLDIDLALEGPDLSQLFPILSIPLPPTPPYALSGHLVHEDDVWTFKQFKGKVGESDLAGDFTLDRSQPVQMLRAQLVSENLRLEDLGGFIGARGDRQQQPAKPTRGAPVLPNEPFNLEKLRAAQADVQFSGKRIVTQAAPIDNMTAHLKLVNGVVTIEPLEFGVAGGQIVGEVTLDASKSVIAGATNLRIRDLDLERLVPKAKSTKASIGTVQGRVQLRGTGNSVAAMLGTSNGGVTLVMGGGEISALVLRLMNLDVANTLVTLVRGDQSIPVRCMVGYFDAKHGHLKPQPFVLDTKTTKVALHGDIDLGTEHVDLRLIAESKDASLVALRGPIIIQGPFSALSVRPDLSRAITRTIAAVALGIVATPVAALLPLFELGTTKDADCKAIVQQAQAVIGQEPGAKPPSPDATEAAGASKKGGG